MLPAGEKTLMLRIYEPRDPDYSARLRALCERSAETPIEIEAAARAIIADVRKRGDVAVRELTAKFETRDLPRFELSRAEWAEGAAEVAPAVRTAIQRAAARVRAFHERERYASFEIADGGLRVGSRVAPLTRVGLYVPGGTARYPSTVVMTAVPAKVAGVGEVIMTTPGPSPETLAAALESGVDRVFVIGGAQAVAALAYGTATVPRVDKIVGPGNAYVAAAKRLVFGDVGIDSIAGPTELVVAADDSVDASWVAADLLAQAEHDKLAVPILIAVGSDVAKRVAAEVERQVALLPRREIAEVALREQGAIFVVTPGPGAAAEVVRLMNLLAPEHAELAMRDARAVGEGITTAGALFLGTHTPESVGDYMAGPSHVLPTGGSARFFSPLGVGDFVKRTSIIEYDAAALDAQGADIEALADVEGLHAHGRAVSIRTRRS
ncbi:MAG: histidinol dehydrogenase [Myxococcales bacterium]|nr:histidinol dehydrogenase [Myxococcales bacterium]